MLDNVLLFCLSCARDLVLLGLECIRNKTIAYLVEAWSCEVDLRSTPRHHDC